MILPLLQVLHATKSEHGMSMHWFYDLAGISRQGYHQALKRQADKQAMCEKITKKVSSYRQSLDARSGSRSLFHNLDIKTLFNVGVNKFELLVSECGLTLQPCRVRIVTTKSSKQSWNYQNRINGLNINAINQVVVGDITYIHFNGLRYYLFCLTDVYSARIVGWCISENMRSSNALAALNQWAKLRSQINLSGCIHHTDGGGQYFSSAYLERLSELKVIVSRANSCLENGYAEQRNGLIKNHLLPLIDPESKKIAKCLNKLIEQYNHRRKQKNLGWLSPVEFEKVQQNVEVPITKTLHNFNKA